MQPPVKWFVLDAEAMVDIDSSGAETLHQVLTSLANRCGGWVEQGAGLLPELVLHGYALYCKLQRACPPVS